MSSLELQKALVGKLKTDPAVTALVDGRVYDMPPINPTFPYISLGPDQTIPDRADCSEGSSDVTLQVDAWSRATGFPEVKRIAEAVRASLQDDPPFSLTGFRLVDLTMLDARTLRDPDGLTSHAAMTFLALTEPV